MAKTDNLGDFLKGIADKFRSTLGTVAPMSPQSFETKIDEVYSKGFSEGGPTGVTATSADVRKGKVFGSGGQGKATGTMPEVEGRTVTPSLGKDTIIKGNAFLIGDQTVKGITQSGISAENIVSGKVVQLSSGGAPLLRVTGNHSPEVAMSVTAYTKDNKAKSMKKTFSVNPGVYAFTLSDWGYDLSTATLKIGEEIMSIKSTPQIGPGDFGTGFSRYPQDIAIDQPTEVTLDVTTKGNWGDGNGATALLIAI